MNIRKLKYILPYGLVKWQQNKKASLHQQIDNKYNSYIKKNSELQGRNLKERCFIIGTGPSINGQNLSLLRDEICIGLNMFYLSDQYELVKPRYNLFSGVAVHPKVHDIYVDIYSEMDQHLHDDAEIFLNVLDIDYLNRHDVTLERKKYFFHFGRSWNDKENYSFDAANTLYKSQNVAIMALQLAIYMGFSEIYLIGCDHDWILRFESKSPTHCYSKNKSVAESNGVTDWSEKDWGFWFRVHNKIWSQYRQINIISEMSEVSIYNATEGGILDIFERKSLPDVLVKVGDSKSLS